MPQKRAYNHTSKSLLLEALRHAKTEICVVIKTCSFKNQFHIEALGCDAASAQRCFTVLKNKNSLYALFSLF